MPLAVPLPFRLGESERKNTLHKSKKIKTKKLTEYQKSQLWRYKLVEGTDKHLQEVFVGKCWLYQKGFKFRESVDCDELWEAFLSGFAYKEPCDVTLEDYKNFFGMIHEDPLVNKVREACFNQETLESFLGTASSVASPKIQSCYANVFVFTDCENNQFLKK